ncbi:MAG: GNAT family N-acetyltransferase [Bacteroidaceae bacterium]|nr:GNAT family N-acetyltransferase [Bacteroidaceae bacterium]
MITTTATQEGNIVLRAVEPHDLDFLYIAENDAQAWNIASTTAPMSRLMLQHYIEQYSADLYRDHQLRLIAERTDNGERIGIVDLYDYDVRNSRAGVGIYITPAMRHRGYGTSALHALCRYAQEFLGIHMLYAHIGNDNAASISIFAKCHFTHTATLPMWIKTPHGYIDAIVMQRTAMP